MKWVWYFVAGLLLAVVQSSWQSPLQETEAKSRSFKASQAEPLDDSRQLNKVKHHSQGTFTSDYSKYLDTRRVQDFVEWLMNTKRSGNELIQRHRKYKRYSDGTYTSDMSSYLEAQAVKELLDRLIKGQEIDSSEESNPTSVEDVLKALSTAITTKSWMKWLPKSS